MKRFAEDYLDPEEKFYNYKTDDITGKVVFDTKTTGMSYYNDLIRDPEYMERSKNLSGEIVYMTPTEYFEGCANIFNSTVERQIRQTQHDKNTFVHLMDVLTKYHKKFPIGFLNYAQGGQEGRHRMLVAAEYSGWETKQPVLVITWADEGRHQREVEAEHRRADDMKVQSACMDALRYRFYNIEELETEIQSQLNNKFSVMLDEPDIPFELTTDEDAQEYTVRCGKGEYSFSYSNVKWEEEDLDLDNLDIDLDELADDDLDEWLSRHLKESLSGPSLAETLERHDTLNPAIWDGMKLKDGVKEAIEEIVDKYVEDSDILTKEDIIDIELLGSNAGYNYTEYSDLDVHLVVNMESMTPDPTLLQVACNAERSLFNKAYNFTIKGVELELYVEDVKSGAASNGVYSIIKDEWLKTPAQENIPDYTDDDEYLSLLDVWMVKARMALNETSSREIQNFVNELYNLRRISIMTDGEYAKGNIVFKEIRNAGILQELKDKIHDLTSKELSLESLKRS